MKFNRVTQTRNNVIDIVKGITILLVIYGHVIQILYMGTGMEFFSDRIEKFICSFHMPLFSLISGYLFYFTCIHRTIKEIFYKRIVGLIQPLLIWGTFYYTLYLVLLNFLVGGGCNLSLREWWNTVSGPFLWFLWSMIAASIIVLLSERMKRASLLFMIVGMWVVYLFPNSEYNVYVYPFFVMGYIFHKYENNIRNHISRKVEIMIVIIFVIMLFFYNEDHYIYTTGISLLTTERSWIQQLSIDSFRYAIGALGSISIIIIIKRIYNRIPKVIKAMLTFCGEKSLEIYILQCIVVSWMFSMLYSNIVLNIYGNLFKRLFKNFMLLDFIIAPIITFILVTIILILLNIINKFGKISKVLFGR